MMMMDNDLIPYPDDDRMDEGNADDLAAEMLMKAEIEEIVKPPTVSVDYIDYEKLETELVNPALSHRLFYMAKVCENRKVEIAKAFERVHAQKSRNTELYQQFHKYIASAGERGPPNNENWAYNTDAAAGEDIEKLTAELKKTVEDGNKEAVRAATTALFDVYVDNGRYTDAIRLYSRCLREYSNTPNLVVPMLFSQVKILILANDIHRVGQYISQIERSLVECQERENAARRGLSPALSKNLANVAAISGLVRLQSGGYRGAAEKFVTVEHEFFDMPDLLAPSDIAIYGTLCALATFNRGELSKLVLNNGNFRKFLAPEGQLVELVRAFDKNSYNVVFDILFQLKSTWALNSYIAIHLNTLFQLIRQRAFVQYCAAFCIIDLVTMAGVFHSSVDELIDELVILIEDGALNSRIDPIAKQLYQIRVDNLKRNSANLKSLQDDVTHRVRAILVRTALAVNVSTTNGGDEQGEMRGTRKGRRGPASNDDFEEEELAFQPEDIEMINQCRQLSFDNGAPSSSTFGHGFSGPSLSGPKNPSQNKFLSKFTKKKHNAAARNLQSYHPPAPGSNDPRDQGDSDDDEIYMDS
uniref:PCI domain-containing protein n=1 Tax=Panagrellus redivivus TaxID=6233 RepID=A0A7E4V4Y6_PANRE